MECSFCRANCSRAASSSKTDTESGVLFCPHHRRASSLTPDKQVSQTFPRVYDSMKGNEGKEKPGRHLTSQPDRQSEDVQIHGAVSLSLSLTLCYHICVTWRLLVENGKLFFFFFYFLCIVKRPLFVVPRHLKEGVRRSMRRCQPGEEDEDEK